MVVGLTLQTCVLSILDVFPSLSSISDMPIRPESPSGLWSGLTYTNTQINRQIHWQIHRNYWHVHQTSVSQWLMVRAHLNKYTLHITQIHRNTNKYKQIHRNPWHAHQTGLSQWRLLVSRITLKVFLFLELFLDCCSILRMIPRITPIDISKMKPSFKIQ